MKPDRLVIQNTESGEGVATSSGHWAPIMSQTAADPAAGLLNRSAAVRPGTILTSATTGDGSPSDAQFDPFNS
jgi:hypothetical protein